MVQLPLSAITLAPATALHNFFENIFHQSKNVFNCNEINQ